MSGGREGAVLRLRAHHICCTPLWTVAGEVRSPEYEQVKDEVNQVLLSSDDVMVMVVEGMDKICQQCSDCNGERCTNAGGDEDAVRKWDAILLRELGIDFNTCLTAGQWRKLIEQKVPYKLCQKCHWKGNCSVGRRLLPTR